MMKNTGCNAQTSTVRQNFAHPVLILSQPEWYEVPVYWPKIEDWVKRALEYGAVIYTPESILKSLIAREMKLWLAMDKVTPKACMVTKINRFPVTNVLGLIVLGGEGADSWLMFSPEIDAYAKAQGCSLVEFYGRGGWTRKVEHLGFKPVLTIFRKELA